MKPHYLGVFFIIAVVVPSIILSFLAVRAVNREEAYIEKQLQKTLMAEVTHTVSLVNNEIKNIQQELSNTVDISQGEDISKLFSQWKEASSLVDVPFLLSRNYEIIWPNFNNDLSSKETSFLNMNRQFFSGEVSVPVYQNIALAYKNEILKDSLAKDLSGNKETVNLDEGKSLLSAQEENLSSEDKSGVYEEQYAAQQALTQFEKDKEVRKKVYDQAKERGQKIASRSIGLSRSDNKTVQKEDYRENSIFIWEPLRFSQITAKSEYGIIPRFIDDKLNFLFWKKDKNGNIAGCLINDKSFKERILSVLPSIYSSERIITIVNEQGRPLIVPGGENNRDWRNPFVAREINEIMPRWEVAAYVTNPETVSLRAQFVMLVMWILVSILFISIVSGGIVVLKSVYSEIKLTQQKTTFVTNVSHELKTPLTSIRMFAEMLKEKRQPDAQKQEKYLSIMVSEIERLTRLINNVLDFSKMSQGKKHYSMKDTDAVILSESIYENQKVRLEHNGFEVNFKADAAHIIIHGDEEAVKQAVLNLLSNAEKYSFDSKKIEIEVSRTDKSAFINIKDRGMGISSKDAENIFKEFYRVDNTLTSKVKGTGLGLTIARQIIRDHGGDILYFPRDGGGSVFQIKLPVKDSV